MYAAQITAIAALKNSKNAQREDDNLTRVDNVFVFLFTAELLVNMYAHWRHEFLHNPWSIFDAIIVGLSLLGLAPIGLPLGLLLLLRCCRVLRIFGKFRAVANIFSALGSSFIPLASTFFIIFVLASVCEYLSSEASRLVLGVFFTAPRDSSAHQALARRSDALRLSGSF